MVRWIAEVREGCPAETVASTRRCLKNEAVQSTFEGTGFSRLQAVSVVSRGKMMQCLAKASCPDQRWIDVPRGGLGSDALADTRRLAAGTLMLAQRLLYYIAKLAGLR